MVNGLQCKRSVVVKSAIGGDGGATAKGGAVVVEALANRLGFSRKCRELLPARRDPSQGYEVTALVSSLMHGLLGGGRGLSATEPMRGDEPLLKVLGMKRAPSAETIEEVVKYLGDHEHGYAGAQRLLGWVCEQLIKRERLCDLVRDGFIECFGDGAHLETDGRDFEGKTYHKNKGWGLDYCGVSVGPYMVTTGFASPGEGEQKALERLLPGAIAFLEKTGLRGRALMLMDSLYGHESTLSILERPDHEVKYVVGAGGLSRMHRELEEWPEDQWRSSGAIRGWVRSEVCSLWLQCEGWPAKRLCVGRRSWRAGEMLPHYFGVLTNLDRDDKRVRELMSRHQISFEQAIWRLYDGKQAQENLWKDQLIDLGLHHPPCARLSANNIFYAIAATAANLATGVRRLALEGAQCSMRLWRFRRDVIDIAATVMLHAREVIVKLIDARAHYVSQLHQAMLRVSRL
jgi:hypothetical protein